MSDQTAHELSNLIGIIIFGSFALFIVAVVLGALIAILIHLFDSQECEDYAEYKRIKTLQDY